jgi:hypothetical protein
MEAERITQLALEACQSNSNDCTSTKAELDATHRDGLERFGALFRRVGGLPTYAMAEQVGVPQRVVPTQYTELWIWEWVTAGSLGQVQLTFDHFNRANTLRTALYCDPTGCKRFFGP